MRGEINRWFVLTWALFLALLIRTLLSGPIPLYATPMLGVKSEIFCTVSGSMRVVLSFFSVAMTTPLFALMPKLVAPPCTAVRAYSICTSFPLGLKVVSENEYCTRQKSSVRFLSSECTPFNTWSFQLLQLPILTHKSLDPWWSLSYLLALRAVNAESNCTLMWGSKVGIVSLECLNESLLKIKDWDQDCIEACISRPSAMIEISLGKCCTLHAFCINEWCNDPDLTADSLIFWCSTGPQCCL